MPNVVKNIIGKTFGRWYVLKRDAFRSGYWICKCACGSKLKSVRGTTLRTGESSSCGCLNAENSSKRQKAKANGNPARQRGTLEYFKCNTWNNIKKRVINGKPDPKNRSYITKGIELRMTKEQFYTWCDSQKQTIVQMKRPSIDRINNDKHYSLDNIQILEHTDNIRKRHGTHCYFTVDSSLNITNQHN